MTNSYLSSVGCLGLYATDKLSPTEYLQFEITLGMPSDGSTMQSFSFFSITATGSVMASLNKFLVDDPNNANIITAPATTKIIANFHRAMSWKPNSCIPYLMYINLVDHSRSSEPSTK